jgi:hypothetical protein
MRADYTPLCRAWVLCYYLPMRQFTLRVVKVAQLANDGAVQVSCEGAAPLFAPGQAALAQSDLPGQPFLRVPLYPFHATAGGFEFGVPDARHPYAGLAPGDELNVLGPCGHGFDLPPRAGHLLVAAAGPARLLALLDWALERGWAVTLWQPPGAPPPSIPELVEVQRGELSAELLDWADMVAVDLPEPARWAAEIRAARPGRAAGFVQALVDVPMPCGTGACQACWVETGRGRKLACVEGPVIQW